MRKIAFHLNCLEQGGAERVVSNLANQFAKKGYEVIVATEWYGENEFRLDEAVRRVHVGLRPEDEKKGRLRKAWLRIRFLQNFLQKEKPDVLLSFARKANYRALAAAGRRLPVIVSVRTNPVGHYDSMWDRLQTALLFPKAAGCVFQTEGQRAFFAPSVQKKSRIILNPVHEKYLNAQNGEQRKVVMQSGRLVDFKNQPMLIDAFLKVRKKHPDYELEIYGGDSHDGTKEILEEKIAQNGAADFIRLMGASDSLEQQLTQAAVFAFSSDWEGLPNALLEAMALGLPVVATDCPCGGPRTVIRDGENGLLVPIRDPEAMAEGICRLIEDRQLARRLGQNAKEIRRLVNPEAVFDQWRDYIEEVVQKN